MDMADNLPVMANSIEGSAERLLSLTDALNLEDCDKSGLAALLNYPFVVDFERLRCLVWEHRRIACSYGLDNPLFDSTVFRKMRVLVCQLPFHAYAASAYCTLKSRLFLEENDFFDEVCSKVDNRLKTIGQDSANLAHQDIADLEKRLMLTVFRLRSVYDAYL